MNYLQQVTLDQLSKVFKMLNSSRKCFLQADHFCHVVSSFEGKFSYVVAIMSKKIIHYAMMFLPFPNKKVIYNFLNTLSEE